MTTSPTLIRDPWQRLWRFASGDVFLAVILAALAALLALSVALPQTPQNDPVAYSRWLSETQQQFGSLTSILTTLGLFSVASSILFRLALGLLGLCCALRLLDQIEWLRSTALPRLPLHPIVDQTLNGDPAAIQTQLVGYGYRLRSSEGLTLADRYPRPAIAAILLYGGALLTLLGLVAGSFIDTRIDRIDIDPGKVTPIAGTPYALRLDSVGPGARASVALLDQTQPVVQGTVALRQPVIGGSFAIYLDKVGPALAVTATGSDGKPLSLQTTASSPPEPDELISFNEDRTEGFVAASTVGVVLQIALAEGDHYTVQAYQAASGKVLSSGSIAPGQTLALDKVTFSFQPASFITVSLVNQPSHWLVIPGWLIAMLGLAASLIWRPRRIWLQAVEGRTRIVSDDATFEPIALATRSSRRDWPWWALWVVLTVGLVAQMIATYTYLAAFALPGSLFDAYLAAWLVYSGGLLVRRRRLRLALIAISLLAALIVVLRLI